MQPKGSEVRAIAARVIEDVLTHGNTLDTALGQARHLPDNDKKLVHAICGFVFRRLPEIDRVIGRFTRKKGAVKPAILHNLLRVGVAQLLYMEIPPHAALNTVVSAAASLNLFRQKSFVNAVLRALQRDLESIKAAPLTALECLPEWLAKTWVQAYGENDAARIAEAVSHQAPLDISFFNLKAKDEWGQVLGGELLSDWSMRLDAPAGQLATWPGFDAGAWWVQDFASSLPINALPDVAGKSVLDIGAAPGGKTMQLLGRGAKVTALDASEARTTRLRDNLARVDKAQDAHIVVADARSWQANDEFDVVVIDAPCSSTGTLRRHPELPWIRTQKQLSDLVVTQREIMAHASKMVRSGGLMLYCTCSLQPEEGEIQVKEFLSAHNDFKELGGVPDSLKPYLNKGLNDIGYRTMPYYLADKGGMDGFFFALLQKQ